MCGPMTSVPSAAQAVEWQLAVDVEMGTIERERLVPGQDSALTDPQHLTHVRESSEGSRRRAVQFSRSCTPTIAMDRVVWPDVNWQVKAS
jgi:hypothetical protein